MAENASPGDTKVSPKTPLDHLYEARADQRNKIIEGQIGLIDQRNQNDTLGGEEDLKAAVERIVTRYPEGISLVRMRGVTEDQKALNKARTALEKDGKIHEVTKGQATVLKPGPRPEVPK